MKYTKSRKNSQNEISQFFIVSAILMNLLCFYSIAAEVSEDEIRQRLGGSTLVPLDFDVYRKRAEEINDCINASGQDDGPYYDVKIPGVRECTDEDELLETLKWQEKNTPAPSPKDILRWRKASEANQYRRQKIWKRIKALKENGFDVSLLTPILSQKKEISSLQLIELLQDFFSERKRVDDAQYFYHLATYYDLDLEEENRRATTGISAMYLDLYNDMVQAQRGDVSETSNVFYLLDRMLSVLGSTLLEEFELMISDVTRIHTSLVRKYISTEALIKDNYYGQGALASKVWAYDFGQQLVAKAKPFRVLLKATHYQDSGKPVATDLNSLLGNVGFKISSQSTYQDIWVHPEGFTVRVKHGEGQFTIGYNFLSPVEWRDDKPILLTIEQALKASPKVTDEFRKDARKDYYLLDFKYNEIFKIAFTEQALFIVPAFRDRYCIGYWKADRTQIDELMDNAHVKLTGSKRKAEFSLEGDNYGKRMRRN